MSIDAPVDAAEAAVVMNMINTNTLLAMTFDMRTSISSLPRSNIQCVPRLDYPQKPRSWKFCNTDMQYASERCSAIISHAADPPGAVIPAQQFTNAMHAG